MVINNKPLVKNMDESLKAVAVYDDIADLYSQKFQTPSDYIDEFLDLVVKGGKILDVGCGCGIDAGYMESRGFTVIGIDLSKKMIKLAKRNFPKIKFEVQDMRKLNFELNSFDGIFVAYSLIHIPKRDVITTLKLLYNFLKKGGAIYIALQSGESRETFLKEPLKPSEEIFLNVFSEKEITQLLEKSGFSVIKQHHRGAKNKEEFNFVKLFVLAKK